MIEFNLDLFKNKDLYAFNKYKSTKHIISWFRLYLHIE